MRYAATAVFMTIVVATGVVHGISTFRWAEKPKYDLYSDKLKTIPGEFEGWAAEELPPFQDNLANHGIHGYIFRNYKFRNSTETYRVLVVVGPGGPIAAHTPDVCNRGAGFTAVGDQKRADVTTADGRVYQLFKMSFKPPATRAADAFDQDIYWTWLVPGQKLRAPEIPRMEFGSQAVLYKIYVIHERLAQQLIPKSMSDTTELTAGSKTPTVDPTKFLQLLLPRLEGALNEPVKP